MEENPKPHACAICPSRFDCRSALVDHVRRHFGIKPYKCNYCQKRFVSSSNRTEHERRRHTHEKPYKCKHCVCRFSTISNIRAHEKIHLCTSCKYYKSSSSICDFCKSGYQDKEQKIVNFFKKITSQ